MSIHLVVNPNAGKKGGLAAANGLRTFLQNAGKNVHTYISTFPGHTIELAANVHRGHNVNAPVEGVVAVGGDGTLFEVVNGLFQGDHGGNIPFPVGQLPVGTGNSFIKDLGIASPDEAASAILGGKTKHIDVGTFSHKGVPVYFVNLLGAGFVSSVAHRAQRYKRFGALSYVIAVLQETLGLKPTAVRLTVDGTEIERNGIFVEICNSRYTGGDMMMAPGASIDDGLLDVIVMASTTRRKLLGLFPKIFSGTHVEDPVIEVFRGRSITVSTQAPWLLTPDGETFGSTPIDVTLLPRSLAVFVP